MGDNSDWLAATSLGYEYLQKKKLSYLMPKFAIISSLVELVKATMSEGYFIDKTVINIPLVLPVINSYQ